MDEEDLAGLLWQCSASVKPSYELSKLHRTHRLAKAGQGGCVRRKGNVASVKTDDEDQHDQGQGDQEGHAHIAWGTPSCSDTHDVDG